MSSPNYKKQVALLLKVLPLISKETAFALHGGTAINLFQHNMPRLSVDIDLTYLPVADRDTSLSEIFLKSIEAGSPLWEIYDFSRFPAVNWKLTNVQKLMATSNNS